MQRLRPKELDAPPPEERRGEMLYRACLGARQVADSRPDGAIARQQPPSDDCREAATASETARTERVLTPPEIAVELSRILAGAELRHAVGGALALGFYTNPRGTLDVDLNVFVDARRPDAALEALAAGGVGLAPAVARAAVRERGELRLDHRGCRVDLFFNSIPLQDKASGRTRLVRLLGASVPILSAEDLIVFKFLYNRHKDLTDVRHVFEVLGDRLEVDYIRAGLIECVGGEDSRLTDFDAILNEAKAVSKS